MAVEAAKQVVQDVVDGPHDIVDFVILDLSISAPMIVPTDNLGLEHMFTAARLEAHSLGGVNTWTYSFSIYSRKRQDAPYQKNATGNFKVQFYSRGTATSSVPSLAQVPALRRKSRSKEELTGPSGFEFYEGLNVLGVSYGPQFRNVVAIGRKKKSRRGGRLGWECETVVKSGHEV